MTAERKIDQAIVITVITMKMSVKSLVIKAKSMELLMVRMVITMSMRAKINRRKTNRKRESRVNRNTGDVRKRLHDSYS